MNTETILLGGKIVYLQNNKNQTDSRLLISNTTCQEAAKVNELSLQNSIKHSFKFE